LLDFFGSAGFGRFCRAFFKTHKFESEIYGCALNFTQICRYTFKFKGTAMDVKLNINLNSNLRSVGKSSAAAGAANLNAGALNLKSINLQSGDRGDILRGASDFFDSANEGESSADILKKQLEKLQKRLKELDNQSRKENERLQRQQEQQAQLAAKAAELERQNKELNLKLSHEQWRNDMLKNVNDELEAENSALKEFIQKAFKYIRIASKSLFDTISDIFSNELTEPLLNDEKKDEEFIDRSKETQQRSNLTPLQPENYQEQKQDEQEQQSDEEKPRKFKARRQ